MSQDQWGGGREVRGDQGWFCPKVRGRGVRGREARGDQGWFCPKVKILPGRTP